VDKVTYDENIKGPLVNQEASRPEYTLEHHLRHIAHMSLYRFGIARHQRRDQLDPPLESRLDVGDPLPHFCLFRHLRSYGSLICFR
jgi:hypothetical protein